ncbi:MAG TPA: putative zinc-binding metallopeptidase [Verrucomicrobiae bacterium]|nr:putative zinc-binding metallopeptidase [Verrucomicrobiae bacterium]
MRFESAQANRAQTDFDKSVANWIPLTHGLNSLNRSMGLTNWDPFILSAPALEKLHFAHEVAREARASGAAAFL